MSEETPAPEGALPPAMPEVPPSTSRSTSIEERRRLVAESLRVGNPGNNARDLPLQADPKHDCQIELPVEAIRPYEHNPRRAGNSKFDEIKASILACGIRNPLTVTRRPGDEHFVVEAGGNTRLLAVQQIWAETSDPRFQRLTVLFRPWRSEAHVLTAHLIENDQRGELGFWDKANGIVALKARLEAETGQTWSLRQTEEVLRALGLSVNTATLSHYLFATERLRTIGEAIPGLTGLDVKTLQPRLNVFKRYAQARASITEDELYAAVFEPVFHRIADAYRASGDFSVMALIEACEVALAAHLGVAVELLRAALGNGAGITPADRVVERPDALAGPSEPQVGQAECSPSTAAPVSTANIRPSTCDRLTEQARRFAQLAGVGDLLRVHEAAPLGYFMESPPQAEDDPSQRSPMRRAWWLLAAASGQLGDSATMPAACSLGDGTHDPNADPATLPPLLDTDFFGWLLDPADEAAHAFWKMVGLIREQRASNGQGRRRGDRALGRAP
jgi:ParB family protein of integrating conjugative element (PFGI_1 class)